jgi:uncharacterized protein YcfJ
MAMKIALGAVAASILISGCMADMSDRRPQRQWRNYDYNRPDPQYGNYDPGRYYYEAPRQRDRRLSNRDRVYRGQDGRYYCRRSDGSTGLIVGAVAGGVLGNIIAPGGSETLGTILGAIAGGAAGNAIDRNNIRCR